MSDIREQIESVIDDIITDSRAFDNDGDSKFSYREIISNHTPQILALFPIGWQSFSEAKPEVGGKVVIKINEAIGCAIWHDNKLVFENEKLGAFTLSECIDYKYQWFHIPK